MMRNDPAFDGLAWPKPFPVRDVPPGLVTNAEPARREELRTTNALRLLGRTTEAVLT